MKPAAPETRLSTGRKFAFYAVYLLFIGLIFLVGAEIILRAKGITPVPYEKAAIRVEPDDRLVAREALVGWAHIPGAHTITLATGFRFRFTIMHDKLRITRPLASHAGQDHRDKIWIFGCSYTEGWSLNDEETYPWLLQERFPAYDVVNYGVGGYGTVHSLIQFREALKTSAPKVAVLAYADFHDERNTLARSHRRAIALDNDLGPLEYPHGRLDSQGRLQITYSDISYTEVPTARFLALGQFVEMELSRFDTKRLRSHEVSEALVLEMARIAREHGVKLVLANIDRGSGGVRMLEFARNHGIPAVDMSVDRKIPGNTNLPHDAHPSARANRHYADVLERQLRAELAVPQSE